MPTSQNHSRWRGLSAGASAEGVAFQSGRPILRAAVLFGKDTYAASIARFTAGLKGSFKQLAKSKIASFTFPEVSSFGHSALPGQPSVQQPVTPLAGNVASLPYSAPAHSLPPSLSGLGPGRPAALSSASASVPSPHMMQARSAALQTQPARTAFSTVLP